MLAVLVFNSYLYALNLIVKTEKIWFEPFSLLHCIIVMMHHIALGSDFFKDKETKLSHCRDWTNLVQYLLQKTEKENPEGKYWIFNLN